MVSEKMLETFWVVFTYLCSLIENVWHAILVLTYGSQRNKLPPIRNRLLLQSASSLAKQIRSKKISSVEVVNAFIDRIEDSNPILNAVIENRFESALEDAKRADEYVAKSGKSEEQLAKDLPFLGVPFTVKNSVGIKGMVMDAGVQSRNKIKASDDCDAVKAMKSSGAIPLCTTNIPEVLMWIDASNTIYGRTSNPYDLSRIPGGSSGGEGALITSAGSVMGLGTDIGGSIRMPAFSCGIFGHKPTTNIVTTKGQFPSGHDTELDPFYVTGPMCRYSEDLLPALKFLAGENAAKLKLDQKVNTKQLKVYYTEDSAEGPFTVSPSKELRESVIKVVKYLETNLGMKAQKVNLPVPVKSWTPIWYTKICSAKAPSLDELITGDKTPLNIPIEFIKWIFRVSRHTLHILTLIAISRYSSNMEPEVVERHNDQADKLDSFFRQLLSNDGVFIFPPQAQKAYFHQELIFKGYTQGYTGLFNILGYPVTVCPTGLSPKDGLPLGVQVIGTPHNDHLTLAVAKEIEKGFGGWKSPSKII